MRKEKTAPEWDGVGRLNVAYEVVAAHLFGIDASVFFVKFITIKF